MPVTSRKLQFESGTGLQIETCLPEFGYETSIKTAWDFQELDDGSLTFFDSGSTYDIYTCNFSLILSASEQATFIDFFSDDGATKSRAKDCIIRMNAGSGFFPFGANKGDVGDFDVAISIVNLEGIGDAPFKYFKNSLVMTKQDSFPAYTPPSEVSEGNFTIGTVTNNRFPPNWFKPNTNLNYFLTTNEDGSSNWIDRGETSQYYNSVAEMKCNESKTAAIFDHLIGSVRTSALNIISDTNYYIFGYINGSSSTYSVNLKQNEFVIVNNRYNEFEFSLNFNYVSG